MKVPSGLQAQIARRSISKFVGPGPTDEELALIVRAATTVPDHGNLHPWRFVVVRGLAREMFGDALAQAAPTTWEPGDARRAKLRGKAFLAPALVVLISVPKDSPKVTLAEQRSSASCTGYAMVLAADALGLGAVWKTAPFLEGDLLSSTLALTPGEEVLGWINLGHRGARAPESARIPLTEVTTELRGDGKLHPFAVPTS